MRNAPTNFDDLIDSRDIIKRIEELEAICEPVHNLETGTDELDPNVTDSEREEAIAELKTLRALADEAEGYSSDWARGETLIRDSYFTDYVEQMLDDCGYVPKDLPSWIVIDMDATAENIKQDYTSVDFDGVEYWIRCS